MIIIVLIGTILYGYVLMKKLDGYISQNFIKEEYVTLPQKDILLYGEPETIAAVVGVLEKESVLYDVTAQPEIKENTVYDWIGAFSEDDMNNLLICMGGKRKNPRVYTIAKCNQNIYEVVFKEMDITIIVKQEISAKQILACLRGENGYDIFEKKEN